MCKKIIVIKGDTTLTNKIVEHLEDINNQVIVSVNTIQDLYTYKNNYKNCIENNKLLDNNIMADTDLIINCFSPINEEYQTLYDYLQFFECIVLKAIDMNVKGIINISSQTVYGSNNQSPSTEIDNLHPNKPITFMQIACESIGWALTRNTQTKLTSIRMAELVGIEYKDSFIYKMISNAKRNKQLNIENSNNVPGFINIEDAAEGLFEFVKNCDYKDWKAMYNLGKEPDYSYTSKNIAEYIKKYAKKWSNIDIEITMNESNNEQKTTTMDSHWFYQDSGWKPKISIIQSIEELYNFI